MDEQRTFSLRLQMLDTDIFTVSSQTTVNDRKSLLSLQNIVRDAVPDYSYCEVGSYLGGTLLPYLLDPLCRRVFSIDKRPPSQPDERGRDYDYHGISTRRMLDTLREHAPNVALGKLQTFDCDVSDLDPAYIGGPVDLALIDAEHTTTAVFRDFLAVKRFLAPSFVLAFHDSNILFDGLLNIEEFLRHAGIKFRSLFLYDVVFALLAGDFADARSLETIEHDREGFIRDARTSLWQEIASNVGQAPREEQLTVALAGPRAGQEGSHGEHCNTLTALADWYGSDKGRTVSGLPPHNYTSLYDLLFRDLRDKEIDFLEIGLAIGGPEGGFPADRYAISPSVQMWLSYFSRARIHGFDITDFSHMRHPRFRFVRGDCGRAEDLRALLDVTPQFDVVIDDASHASYHQQNAFKQLFPALRPGGLYIIEDLHWQSPHYEETLPAVPKTWQFLKDFFEDGSYTENQLLSREFMDAAKQKTYFFTYFRDFTHTTSLPKLIVIRKNGVPAWSELGPDYPRPAKTDWWQAAGDAAIEGLQRELGGQRTRLAEIEAALAAARAETAAETATIQQSQANVTNELVGVWTTVQGIAEQLAPLQAAVAEAKETLEGIERGTETWLMPTLARHSALLARRSLWRRMLGAIASRKS